MNIKIILQLLIIAFVSTNCNKTQKNASKDNTTNTNPTPEILTDNQRSYNPKSSRYQYDIITSLYNEALEKNDTLQKFDNQIIKMASKRIDSLSEYDKYTTTNDRYWLSSNNHIEQIKDSLLRKTTQDFFNTLQQNYNNKLKPYKDKLAIVEKRDSTLTDQHTLMKLLISADMMMNYQKNEKPAIDKFDSIISTYDQLIKDSKAYTNFNK